MGSLTLQQSLLMERAWRAWCLDSHSQKNLLPPPHSPSGTVLCSRNKHRTPSPADSESEISGQEDGTWCRERLGEWRRSGPQHWVLASWALPSWHQESLPSSPAFPGTGVPAVPHPHVLCCPFPLLHPNLYHFTNSRVLHQPFFQTYLTQPGALSDLPVSGSTEPIQIAPNMQ